MFKEFVGQVRRLFSSKTNGGKLVYTTTDRLHSVKQALLAVSIVLLLGYKNFRDDFDCDPEDSPFNKNFLKNHCWTNGTTTINLLDDNHELDQANSHYIPHVGVQFKLVNGHYEVINHNYMKSLWAMLIILTLCSFIAQRSWSAIFNHDTLRALLQLPGYKDLQQVKVAEQLRPYELLIKAPTGNPNEQPPQPKRTSLGVQFEDQVTEKFQAIEILDGDNNQYNHILDYYSNQLIYMLLAKRAAAYKLSELRLRFKLVRYALLSMCLTSLQFLIPLLVIGPHYKLYGWLFFKEWLRFVLRQMKGSQDQVNTIDYGLSARIWPTITHCQYRQYGVHDMDSQGFRCTVPINEICGKLFVAIWWFVVINLVIEFYSLIDTLVCSSHYSLLKRVYGRRYWPKMRKEAAVIATFRYYRALRSAPMDGDEEGRTTDKEQDDRSELNENDRKMLEAESERRGSTNCIGDKKWYLWCSKDIGDFLADRSKQLNRKQILHAKTRTRRDLEGFRETKEDFNVYYLLYFLCMRLQGSRVKTEQVIRMTSDALSRYLTSLKYQEIKRQQDPSEQPVAEATKA